ncbi:thiamine diphosphokinase [Rossellomorea marisflavi]|jgi:thiamine pyrophosphokinase|uniref:thiamine diphosphokinase n=1 Tax=Rossellomorea marisflavi TaxID=189381 RepID=UPI001EE1DCF3|nr:thiamine diphosphokinase [Rossellomorea marisflavi]UKS67094.1 thiamine diphosphokinase [Rossellomorea marisflavi]
MKISILAGGPTPYLPPLVDVPMDGHIWVGVDRGVFTLLEKGMEPHVAFGDFDSVSPREWQLISSRVEEVNRYRPEKDETDLELALNWAAEQEPEEITIYGATGGRLDHFMGNVQLLLKDDLKGISVRLVDSLNEMSIKRPGEHEVEMNPRYTYISFVPISPIVKGLTLSGFKYPLTNRNIYWGSTLCISNELIQSHGTFSFSDGIIMVIRSNDAS